MIFSLTLHEARWQTVITLPKGTAVPKGRVNEVYKAFTGAAGAISYKCGCYSFSSASRTFYCGSFKGYGGGRFTSSLQGRMHQYLQNHRIRGTGQKNTNLVVFENINNALKEHEILLSILRFESLQIGDETIDFHSFTEDRHLTASVEELLIATYRRHGQCEWNRT